MTQQEEKEWQKVQKKTFTKWVNEKLARGGHGEIEDMFEDLCDGVKLAHLLMVLQKDMVEYNPTPYTRIQKMENVERVLSFIKEKKVKLINIGASDIVDGNPKLILGLIWSLISRLAIAEMAEAGELSIRNELLRWCKEVTNGYKNVNIVDFSRSWQDGLAFNAIIHRFRPDLVPNFQSLKSSEKTYNLTQAFKVAEKFLNIKRLLDVEDIAEVSIPDEKSIMTYVSGYYRKFKEYEREKSARDRIKGILETVDWSIQARNLYEIKARNLLSLIKSLSNQKKEVCKIIRSLNKSFDLMLETNSKAIHESTELHSLLGSINAIHDLYRIKKYSPPEDVSLDKLLFPPLQPQTVADSIEIKKLFDPSFQSELDALNRIFEFFKHMLLKGEDVKEQIQSTSELTNKLMEITFTHPLAKVQKEGFKSIASKKLEALRNAHDNRSKEEKVLESATSLFNKVLKKDECGISSSDLCWCLSQLGLSIDEGMVPFGNPEGRISLEDYLLIVKEMHSTLFDPSELKKAFEMLSVDGILDLRSLNIESKDLKNVYHLNGEDPSLCVSKFFDDFIEN
ncbi:Ca2+-binding actin-bundling fimbrin/plastin [Encephalitozoon hellem ATCC 50504]|uniref:Calponin domain-containing protein n=1 Tax=Encephalitozoon hellem TaxID=27973 RepID=A0A9Q9C4D2_ENCHE|nr:Ca2+-binding actin-bundling fimbrin/plastin [Encephalitozoon hellem ATCC 50504]AFM98923.1 Ca2+-binding actin-bundling fimbrin/plastin [Encephalitozoon hellem ATCC 50504]UTX43936.1 calponin homology domain-containing protein [Encephalitozoon hellem]WEL39420.1 calponin domain-containing protein [Encephalitozoon hellem]|eukprot:XP_003887904.1 Ca2+-binding actin-bundling fimbrin/plastin [Encephalitozoon hellem ATCC 50504]